MRCEASVTRRASAAIRWPGWVTRIATEDTENTEESKYGLSRLLGDLCGLCGLILAQSGTRPRWIEILVSAGVVAGGLLVWSVMDHNLPIVAANGPPAAAARRP